MPPKKAAKKKKRDPQRKLDGFVSPLSPAELAAAEEARLPHVREGERTAWTDKGAAKRQRDREPTPDPRNPPETTVRGLIHALPRQTIEAVILRAVEGATVVTLDDLKGVLLSLRTANLVALPTEVLVLILEFLPLKERLTFILSVSMRFRRLIAAPSIWKHINVLKEHSKQVYKRWIDSNGLHRLLTKAVPKGVVASLTVGNIPKNILFQIVEAHPSIQELNLIGSNYDQHNKLSGMRKLERLKILRVLTSDHGGRRMPSCVHEIIRTSNNLEELALNCSVFEAPANQPNWIHPSEDLPTVLANKDPRLPVHATLRRLTLESSVSMKVFMSLLQTCVALREVELSCLNMSGLPIHDENAAADSPNYLVVALPDDLRRELEQKVGKKGSFASLETLAVRQTVAAYNARFLALIGRWLGDGLRELALGFPGSGVETFLRGNFPALRKLELDGNLIPWQCTDAPKRAAAQFAGLYAPKLEQVEWHREGYIDPKACDAYIDTVGKCLGGKVEVRQSRKSPFSRAAAELR